MNDADLIRKHLADLLRGGSAYDTFDQIVDSFAPDTYGTVPPGAEHSARQILEHMQFTQRDIIEFIDNDSGSGKYVEKSWPEDYWPKESIPPTATTWAETKRSFLSDRAILEQKANDPAADLFTPLAAGDGQTLLREISSPPTTPLITSASW